MGKYIIKVLPAEGCNEEYAPEKKEMDGIECDAYLILGFKKEEISFECISGTSIEMLRKFFINGGHTASVIMQAAQIAEGYLNAMETRKIYASMQSAVDLFKNIIIDALESEHKGDAEE